ncbi:hypothetical protein [Rhodococcus erythropolis]|uniref:hypothetical protein n=1 Tax=Rhodococcus erythropolis TaxID=1833 RepID=UPI0036709220
MKRLLFALTIPAALILSGCSNSSAEGGQGPSVTSTSNPQDAVSPTSAAPASPVATSTTDTPTATVEQTPEGAAMSPGEAQMCRDLLGMMERFPGTSVDERREALTNLRAESVASGDWPSETASEQASIDRAFNAAMNGAC